ncbi:DNA-dependent helicase II [Gimesia chilikensis]|uniref:DNA-dependent helicase II n=1 Tax=Gimesia chilikensis TaxID=2605989 RepID=A0A517W6Z5_9PLAN|nr:UvrD-helicase domain-containing protein [Gimesia chilikensis]QDU01027.1 DNA-dependent helicase II [Gimesia chilikensis]
MTNIVPTKADGAVVQCLREKRSFTMVAGAGSGKTTSLVETLKAIEKLEGRRLLRDGQHVVCITYTNRAAEVIRDRLRQNPLFIVSTLHSFLWGEMKHFPNSIRESLRRRIIPDHISKLREKDNGGKSKAALEARTKIEEFQKILRQIDSVENFHYGDDTIYSNFLEGEIGHDDLLALAADLISRSHPFRRVLGQKYPYWLVDEAQDTSPAIIDALNSLCNGDGIPIVGYFGDPMQQIYDAGMGDFTGPENSCVITKEENYRSSPQIIKLLNVFRNDVKQIPAGKNKKINGSIEIMLVRMEEPAGARNSYSDDQLGRAQNRLAEVIDNWGWTDHKGIKQLFLARRMIARRLGFLALHELFTGSYASSRAKNSYEKGEHLLLKPFVTTIVPLIQANSDGDNRAIIRILTSKAPAFNYAGEHSDKTIREVRLIANEITAKLSELFENENLGAVLRFSMKQGLISASERLKKELVRPKRNEDYNENLYGTEKSDWLADSFFEMAGAEVEKYCSFLDENTPYSTQHGVKGEEYEDVLVVFDDTEAAWYSYSFGKLLTPQTAGEAKDTQLARSQKLAYVCFSRAVKNLRIVLFTPKPEVAKDELLSKGLFNKSQIKIWE